MEKKLILFTICFIHHMIFAQDSLLVKKEIDPSKPTNLYTQLNSSMEYRIGKNQNLYGLRTNIQYAINSDNLFLIEVPFLYNEQTSKLGISDLRIRYFNAIKRNLSRNIIAIAPFADVTIPSGSYENGLGTSCWSLAGGVVMGIVVSRKFSLFPGASYVHITKPSTTLIPEESKNSSNGIGLQFNASYRFDRSTFLFINPNPTFLYSNGIWTNIWTAELNLNKILLPNKFKINLGISPNFTNELYTFKLGGTFYL